MSIAARNTAGLGTIIGTELYRARRGSLVWLMSLTPLVIALPMVVSTALGADWPEYRGMTLTGWGSLLPAFIALLVGIAVTQDREAWLFLLAAPVARNGLVLAKMASLAVITAVPSLILGLALWIGGINSGVPVPGDALAGAAAMWVALLGIAGLMLLLTLAAGMATTIAVGVVGALAGMLTADKAFWFLNPFGWPLRAMLPFGQVRANGVALPPGSPLADLGPAFAAMLLSVVLAAAATALSCMVLRRKEI